MTTAGAGPATRFRNGDGRDPVGHGCRKRLPLPSAAGRKFPTPRRHGQTPRQIGTRVAFHDCRNPACRPSDKPFDDEADPLIPGEVLYGEGDVVIIADAEITTIRITNTADRAIEIGSHYHFAELNAALDFDRKAAWGKRLAVLSGGGMRFEPGAVEEVELIPIRGPCVIAGLRGLCRGRLDDA